MPPDVFSTYFFLASAASVAIVFLRLALSLCDDSPFAILVRTLEIPLGRFTGPLGRPFGHSSWQVCLEGKEE